MGGLQIGEILLELAFPFGATYLLGSLLIRLRFPVILGVLLVGMGVMKTRVGTVSMEDLIWEG